jgi:hypothetical protein
LSIAVATIPVPPNATVLGRCLVAAAHFYWTAAPRRVAATALRFPNCTNGWKFALTIVKFMKTQNYLATSAVRYLSKARLSMRAEVFEHE